MADKVPIRAVFDGTTATGLAEFQSGDTVGLTYGGLGASLSLGSAGQLLKVNSGGTAVEFGSTVELLTVDNIVLNGTTIGHTSDTDLITLASGAVTIAGDLTVTGTQTINQTTVNVQNAFIFEGATADAHETTFRIDEPTADRTASLQDKSGTLALLSGFKLNATDGSSTDDGDFIVLNTSADDGDRLLFEDGTSDPIAVLASHGITMDNN